MKLKPIAAAALSLLVLAASIAVPFSARADGEGGTTPAPTAALAAQDPADPNDLSQYYAVASGKPGDTLTIFVPLTAVNGDLENVGCALDTSALPAQAEAPSAAAAKTADGSETVAALATGAKAYFSLSVKIKDGAAAGNAALRFLVTYTPAGGAETSLPVSIPFAVKAAATPTAVPDASASDGGGADITYESGGGSGGGGSSFKSKPKVIVSGYTFDQEKLYAGESFRMNLKLRNTSTREAVKNLQLNFSNEAGIVLPVSGGSNSIFIGDLAKDSIVSISVGLQIAPDAEPKAQMLSLEITYEGTKNKQEFTEKSSIAVPVLQKTRVRTDVPVFYDEAYAGQSCSMSVQMFNMGKSSLYNCMVEVEGEGLSLEETYYAGNIASGGTLRADLTLLAQTAGEIQGAVVISYEDVYGDRNEERLPFTLSVGDSAGDAFASDGAGMAGFATAGNAAMAGLAANGAETGGAQAGFPWYYLAIVAVAAVGLVILLIVALKRRRARMLSEMLPDDADLLDDAPLADSKSEER